MTRVTLTYADYAALPDDGRRYELHDGELSVTPAPGIRHQRVKANLFDILRHQVLNRHLGEVLDAPTDCILSDTTVVQPDILFIDSSRAALLSERAVEGPPTLVVEVLSPSTEGVDRRRKLELYARHGVPHYWIVDPAARVIEVYSLAPDGYRPTARLAGDQPTILPPFDGLSLDPAAIWA